MGKKDALLELVKSRLPGFNVAYRPDLGSYMITFGVPNEEKVWNLLLPDELVTLAKENSDIDLKDHIDFVIRVVLSSYLDMKGKGQKPQEVKIELD